MLQLIACRYYMNCNWLYLSEIPATQQIHCRDYAPYPFGHARLSTAARGHPVDLHLNIRISKNCRFFYRCSRSHLPGRCYFWPPGAPALAGACMMLTTSPRRRQTGCPAGCPFYRCLGPFGSGLFCRSGTQPAVIRPAAIFAAPLGPCMCLKINWLT